ncbi:MAG: hypothetical protein K9M11_03055 [Candidatus Pacebacteria bacterium]|nr:hypothetical protein [Candidatus Paceibacterota bacterium]
MPAKFNTRIAFEGINFSFSSFPFNIAPTGKITTIPGAILSSIQLRAEPVNCKEWRQYLLDGKMVCFKGVKAGTTQEIIEVNMRAERSTPPNTHLIISFIKIPTT